MSNWMRGSFYEAGWCWILNSLMYSKKDPRNHDCSCFLHRSLMSRFQKPKEFWYILKLFKSKTGPCFIDFSNAWGQFRLNSCRAQVSLFKSDGLCDVRTSRLVNWVRLLKRKDIEATRFGSLKQMSKIRVTDNFRQQWLTRCRIWITWYR